MVVLHQVHLNKLFKQIICKKSCNYKKKNIKKIKK